MISIRCHGCLKRPHELECYVQAAESTDPEVCEAYVIREEGTFNDTNGHFLCDECYIKAGQPSSPTGWVCP